MLFGYPLVATANNWLHDCLCAMIGAIHTSLGAAQAPPEWPDVIPTQYRDQLRNRPGLRDRLDAYTRALRRLSAVNRERVLNALNDQNQINLLLSCRHECEAIDDLPALIRKPIEDLFSFAFKLLTPLGVRDTHYQEIYTSTEDHVCPFCGCEYFDAPGAPREALDHYLKESTYPFAAANLRNLVPMGDKCNSRYKLAQDILRKDDGTRRSSFDPYNHAGVRISLDDSQPFAGLDGQMPRWQIDFDPDSPEAATWDEIFHIRERYVRDVLNPSFKRWLGNFGAWFKRNVRNPNPTEHEMLTAIQQYIDNLEPMELGGRDFLRERVFQMLYRHCHHGDQRLIALMKDTVTISSP